MNGIASVLKRAKEMVTKGWTQHQAVSDDGRHVCAAQAMMVAAAELHHSTDPRDDYVVAERALLLAAAEQTGMPWGSVPHWNDHPPRTQQEVLDTFDHAIKLVERDLEVASG